MDLICTILKFAGVVAAGFGAMIVAVAEACRGKRSESAQPQPFWSSATTKQSGLYLAIIGLFVALLFQFVEISRTFSENKAAQTTFSEQMVATARLLAELERQSVLASNSLEEIQRGITRFEHITVPDAIYELPASEPGVAALSEFLQQSASEMERNPTNYVGPALECVTYSDAPAPTGNAEGSLYVVENLASFQAAFKTNTAELSRISSLLKSLLTPDLVLRLSKAPLDLKMDQDVNPGVKAQPDDFSAQASRPKFEETSLVFSPPKKQIFVHWHGFVFPKEQWQISGKIISAHDLGKAHCYFTLYASESLNGTDVYENMLPRHIEVNFDSHAITLEDFHRIAKYNSIMGTTLPANENILNGTASKEVDWP
jgi:hypothetical protein